MFDLPVGQIHARLQFIILYLYRTGIGGRGTDEPSGEACGCDVTGGSGGAAAAGVGAKVGTGLRGRATGRRGGNAMILACVFCAGVFAASREIGCWLALSCSLLALSCTTSWLTLARSRAIDCSNCVDSV